MGSIQIPQPSKLITGLIYHNSFIKNKALKILEKKFGKIDFISDPIKFDYTDYYYQEMGRPLKREIISFKKLLIEDTLANIKIYTNKLEDRFTIKNKRQINIDPGFLSFGKLILATTKNNRHRIYLKKGIFAEITLFFQDKTYRPWEWTYPDYQSKEIINIFNSIRNIYDASVPKSL